MNSENSNSIIVLLIVVIVVVLFLLHPKYSSEKILNKVETETTTQINDNSQEQSNQDQNNGSDIEVKYIVTDYPDSFPMYENEWPYEWPSPSYYSWSDVYEPIDVEVRNRGYVGHYRFDRDNEHRERR